LKELVLVLNATGKHVGLSGDIIQFPISIKKPLIEKRLTVPVL
jgi:hypothetical protein